MDNQNFPVPIESVSKLRSAVRELAKTESRWVQLQEAGRFDEEKAALSMLHTLEHLADIQPTKWNDVFKHTTPTLATVRLYHGEEKSIAAIQAIFMFLDDFLGEKSGLTEAQNIILSKQIMADYYYLSIADLKLFLKKALDGQYGDIYGRLNPNVIMGWLRRYVDDRHTIATMKSEAQAGTYKQPSKNLWQAVANAPSGELAKIRESLMKVSQSKVKEDTRKWKTLAEYCQDNDLDLTETRQALAEDWQRDFDPSKFSGMTLAQYLVTCEQDHLIKLNEKYQSSQSAKSK